MSNIYDKSSLVLIPSGTKTGKVFSQKPVSGDGDFTFTRASAATRVNADGNIEKETQNLLRQSNTFDTTWGAGGTLVGGQSGYDGTNNAWSFTSASGTSGLSQNITTGGVQTFSAYIKKNATHGVRVYMFGGLNAATYFNLNTGSVVYSLGGTLNASIEAYNSEWWRVSVTCNTTLSQIVLYCTDNNQTQVVGTITIQDAQLEQGLVARDVITTTTAAVYGGITDNTPRLDYTDSSCPALLLEPLRTNNIAHSEYLVGISAVNATTSANEAISPDGGNNATKLGTLVAAPNGQWARYYNIVQTNQKQALSIYAKAGNIDDFTITYYDQSTGDIFFNYDLGVGSVSAPTGNANYVDADIQDLGNGWYRCIAVVNAQAAGTNGQFQVSAGVQRVVQNIGDYVYIYGYQWEQDATYATSYIPTYGSSVSRVAENSAVSNAEDLIGQTEGTIFIECEYPRTGSGGSARKLISVNDGTSANLVDMFVNAGLNTLTARVRANSGGFGSIGISNNPTGMVKIAYAYKANDYVLYINGTQYGSVTSGGSLTFSSALDIIQIGDGEAGGDELGGKASQTLLFKTRLSNEELAALTTI